MKIKDARFVVSNSEVAKCPVPDKPEFAFIGRSNVGKSSLVNMLTGRKSLAKTSGKPGKTRLINHFLINDEWYLVDLPGYGYAKTSRKERIEWEKSFREYILQRENLYCLFVLIDSRHEPLPIDLSFMEWLGINQIAFAIIFTKIDKLKPKELENNLKIYKEKMFDTWEQLPPWFYTSTMTDAGRPEILQFIKNVMETALKDKS